MGVQAKRDISRERKRSSGISDGIALDRIRVGEFAVPVQQHSQNGPDDIGRSAEAVLPESVELSMESGILSRHHGDLAIPVPLGAVAYSANSPRRSFFHVVSDRVLDSVPDTKTLTTLNYLVPISVVLMVLRTFLAVDLASAAVTLLVGCVPLLLYMLKTQSDRRRQEARLNSLTGENILKLAHDEHQRITETAQDLREEERAFVQRQLDRSTSLEAISRQRSHVYANAFSGLELANIMLLEYMEREKIPVPEEIKNRAKSLRETLWRDLDRIASQESGIANLMTSDSPPDKTTH